MKKIFIFMISLFLLAVYTTVHAEYKIILKNGGKFIASDYKKEGNSIKLYTPNGEIEIDKSNVESIKSFDVEEGTNDTAAKQEKETPKTEENKKSVVKNTEDPFNSPIKVKTPESKTSNIEKKENELKAEKTKLQEELKKLEEDFKKEGRLMPLRKKREFEQRSQELNKKTKEYNDKIKKLEEGQNNVSE